MRIYGVTYCDDRMTISAERCGESAIACGVDQFNGFDDGALDPSFTSNNYDVLTQERGAGYWLWKPFVIHNTINSVEDEDIVVYSDAGVEFIAPVQHIIDRMDEDIFFFTNGHPHIDWCKMDVIDAMLPGFAAKIGVREIKQVQASVIFFKVNQKTRDFVKEWLLWSQMPGFIDDSPSEIPNYPTFQEHRHDQAILTCLQIKYGYKMHWWPTQYSQHIRVEGDHYPVMFNHHRMRNNEYKNTLTPSH